LVTIKVNKEKYKNKFLLGWYKTTVKYKGGIYDKGFTVFFDENDKIDVVNQYLDRATME
jgi:hypothetical protein